MPIRRRKNVFDDLEAMDREIDQFFGRVFSLEPMWDVRTRSLKPLYDIRETKDHVLVTVDLPYVKKEDIELRVSEESIDLSAQLSKPVRYDRWGTAQRDCEFRALSTIIPLPTEIVPDDITASFRDGILRIELPNKLKKKRIQIE